MRCAATRAHYHAARHNRVRDTLVAIANAVPGTRAAAEPHMEAYFARAPAAVGKHPNATKQ